MDYIYTCMHGMCIYVHICTHTHHINVQIQEHIYVHIYARSCAHIYVHIHVHCTHICAHMSTYMYTYIQHLCIHTCTHACMYTFRNIIFSLMYENIYKSRVFSDLETSTSHHLQQLVSNPGSCRFGPIFLCSARARGWASRSYRP